MALLIVVWCCCRYWRADSKTSVLIEEFWARERVLAAFPNFWCCSERWSGLNRISHPDWVKIFGDLNGQIKLRAKQKYEVLSATSLLRWLSLLFDRFSFFFVNYHQVWSRFFLFENFSHQRQPMVSHWSLSDSKSPQVSWTLLSILTDLNNALIRKVSNCHHFQVFLSFCHSFFDWSKSTHYYWYHRYLHVP